MTGGLFRWFRFWGLGVCLGAPFLIFLFLFLFLSGKRGVWGEGILLSSSSFNYSNPFFTSTQQMIPHLRRKKRKKKTHPNIGPPVPKNKLKLPTFIHVGNFSHPT